MSAGTLVPLAEYLATSYDPDVEYVDGVLVERNVGDWLHSLIQSNLVCSLQRKHPHLFAVPDSAAGPEKPATACRIFRFC